MLCAHTPCRKSEFVTINQLINYLVGVRLEGTFPKCLFNLLLVRIRGHKLIVWDLQDLAVLVELMVLEQGG